MTRRDALLVALLAALPVVAHAPAWREGRLLGPGDGAALHFPLRAEAWRAYERGDLPTWNAGVFSGAPLLASYRPGAFHPLMLALALLPPFEAFQVLVLASLSATGVLTYLYLRRLQASPVGAYVSGLAFPLGPFFVASLGDTATLVAAPGLPLVLLAAEAHLARGTPRAAAGLAGAVALLALAGSPEAAGAGALLLFGRLLLAHGTARPAASPAASFLAVLAGLLLAAPQLLPTLAAWRAAGPGETGVATPPGLLLPGVTGLVVRYVSHTPGPALALAALPLVLTHAWVRRATAVVLLGLLLLARHGGASFSGTGALLADFGLAVLLGLSLSTQWRERLSPLGRRLRMWLLLACLASVAALSVAATVTGPLPQVLTGAVGVLAVSLVLYFSLAEAREPVVAHAFLIPLTVSFLLQPHGREAWAGAPTADEMTRRTATREALDRAMGQRRDERTLSLALSWPRALEEDLAFANRGGLLGRRNAEGYDPLVPRARLALYDGMSASGVVTPAFLHTDPGRLEFLGIRFVQVPTTVLVGAGEPSGLGDELDVVIEPGRARFFALPITRANEVRIVSSLSRAVEVPQGAVVAHVTARLVSGREVELEVRAGVDTAEWAYDRADVRDRVRHARPRVAESFRGEGGFLGHHYLATLHLPARYALDGLRVQVAAGAPPLRLLRAGVADALTGRAIGISLASAYVSDTVRLAETAATPNVRLFEVLRGLGRAWVVDAVRRVDGEEELLSLLRSPTRAGIDARRVALVVAGEAKGLEPPPNSRSSRAELAREIGGRIELRAEGPGLLVVTETWDPGWSAEVDDAATPAFRVNGGGALGVTVREGTHRVVLHHRAPGLFAGFLISALAGLGLLAAAFRG